jgi:hypothetical protein
LVDTVPSFNFEISIDSRLSLFELKERIAELLGLDLDNFIMKRGSRFSAELKDLTTAIKDNGIIGRGTMYLMSGRPSVQGEYKIRVGMGGISKQRCDTIEFDCVDLLELSISNNQTVAQLKEVLVKEVKEKLAIELDHTRIRLREKVNLKLGKVFHNNDMLKSHRIYDR